MMAKKMSSVELRGCEKTRAVINAKEATDEDYYTEYHDYILAVKGPSAVSMKRLTISTSTVPSTAMRS